MTVKELHHVDPMRLQGDPASAAGARGYVHHVLYGPSGNMDGAGALVFDEDDVYGDCDHYDMLLPINAADESNQYAMGLLQQAMPAVAWNKYLTAELLTRLYGDGLDLDTHLDSGEESHNSVANHFRAQVNAVCTQDDVAAGRGASGPSRVDATLGSLNDAMRGIASYLNDSASVLASAVSDCCRFDTGATGDLPNNELALTALVAVDTVKGAASALKQQRVKTTFGRHARQPRQNRERAAAATHTPPVTAVGFAAHANTAAAMELGPTTNIAASTGQERATALSAMAMFMDESTLAAVTTLRGAIEDSPKSPNPAALAAVATIGDRFVWLQAKVLEKQLTTKHIQAAVSDNYLKTMALQVYNTADKAATEPPATAGPGLLESSSRARKAPEYYVDVSAVGAAKKPSKEKNKKKRADAEEHVVEYIEQVNADSSLYKVKWKGYPKSESTWEPVENLSKALTDEWSAQQRMTQQRMKKTLDQSDLSAAGSVDPTDDDEDADDNDSEVEAEVGEDHFEDVSDVLGHRINVDDMAVEVLVDFGESRGKELEFDEAFRAGDSAGPGKGRYGWVTKSKVGNGRWAKISKLRAFKKVQGQLKRSSEGGLEGPIRKRRAIGSSAGVALAARTDSIATFLSRLTAADAELKKRIEGLVSSP